MARKLSFLTIESWNVNKESESDSVDKLPENHFVKIVENLPDWELNSKDKLILRFYLL